MSLAGSANTTVQACGVSLQIKNSVNASMGIDPVDSTVPAGTPGTITSGTVTLQPGHGLSTGTYDVLWGTGSRIGCTGTISSNSCAISGGSGDSLPSVAATPVVIQTALSFATSFDGDNLALFGVLTSNEACVTFVDGGAVVLLSKHLSPGCGYSWCAGQGTTPITGNPVAAMLVSNGSSVTATTIQMTGLQFAV